MTHNKIIQATLTRSASCLSGTFGRFEIESLGFACDSLELPWRDNLPMISCIPTGEYFAEWLPSKMLKRDAYRLSPTAPRAGILIHPANYAGDKSAGFRSDLHGCIALGRGHFEIDTSNGDKQKCIASSKTTTEQFEALCNRSPLKITIRNLFDQPPRSAVI